MKAAPLLVAWHDDNAAIYSAHFEPHGKGRLATAGGDNNVRLWKIEGSGEDRKVTYLSTLVKHTQAVNVVRWCPRGELLGSAGDDGNVLLWVPSETQTHRPFGEDGLDDKETWRVKHMCRSLGSEIYDMAWSPDGAFFITGSMDNIARIYNTQNGQIVRQIAEHSHYVQGVAWDPLNEFVATQSSDRSVHIYTLKTKDGQFSLAQHSKVTKMDLPARRVSNSSPAPPDLTSQSSRASFVGEGSAPAIGSPTPSAPGTPASLALPMNPPTSHSRRSSFGSQSRRSVSPAPSSMPLPAVMPSTSPNIHAGLAVRNANIYANETLTSFFRRLTFAPDGSLLFTPAGQYKTLNPGNSDAAKTSDDIINTVYIYTRAGLNKPPIAYLPGHKKPSIAVRCSPVYYQLRDSPPTTRQITIDTSSADEEILALPEPALPSKPPRSSSSMDPPPITSAPSPSPSAAAASPRPDSEKGAAASPLPSGPPMAFSLPYRMVYAVATQDAVHIYDTQQQKPLCIVSNLHFATFTDLAWSTDGSTLLMTSSDGFCSCLTFAPGELGQVHPGPAKHHPASINTTTTTSNQSTPTPTPTQASAPPVPKPSSSGSGSAFPASPSSFAPARPASPARSMSASSVATQSSFAPGPDPNVALNQQTPSISAVPGVAAANSGPVGQMPMWTPPHTPMPGGGTQGGTHSAASSVSGINPPPGSGRRESESEKEGEPAAPAAAAKETSSKKKREGDKDEKGPASKKRRIAPTLVSTTEGGAVPQEGQDQDQGQGESPAAE
ncbi:putative WD repeat-containing protein C26H5.03 [Lasiodiplodia hormozganensis]|uniref:WD repeat-containing protein C26H5.03 n=1 Tax=Lasiodiplodia hormozganensis TaxID=869390 RepID=A0AA40CJB2_9PEZI|nr:putative WD repeat-containing protein C26H5.03 [Lasiodiplodia hormozganensis]